MSEILKYPMLLSPVSKEIIWGGDRLRKEYGKTAPFDKIAESWELTVREKENSVISNGEYAGMTLADYIAKDKEGITGTASMKYPFFPLLIKFIDAADKLSIQVHPDDEYALANEGEFGKTEMWYIVAADEGAKLVYGLKDGCTCEEFAEAVKSNRTEELLNFTPVKAGETYFIPSGQVHAIGSGILIAEIQQNSNITYRLYDYNRPGADGNPRQLHTDKALKVIKLRDENEISALRFARACDSADCELLCSCEYFTVARYTTEKDSDVKLNVTEKSFASLLVLEAEDAKVSVCGCEVEIGKGDSVFIPAGSGETVISGNASVIVSTVE